MSSARDAPPALPPPRLAEGQLFEPARPERYTGLADVARLLAAHDDSVRAYEVRFTAGARTVWHTHAGEHWLTGLVGHSIVQCAGAPARQLGPGEAIRIPAGVRHWHGAGAESGASHLVLIMAGPTTWEDPVSVADYAAALKPG